MILKVLPIGMFGSNCYIVGDRGECMVIDAGVDADEVIRAVDDAGLKVKLIILTHGHVDHICSAAKLQEMTGAQIMIHEEDSEFLESPINNASAFLGTGEIVCKADRLLQDGDTLEVGGLKAQVIHTPGHTPGGICIKVEDKLFTGDTLFRTSIGRTDLPGGNHEQLIESIISKLLELNNNTDVYPGHGSSSTIGHEKRFNPFF